MIGDILGGFGKLFNGIFTGIGNMTAAPLNALGSVIHGPAKHSSNDYLMYRMAQDNAMLAHQNQHLQAANHHLARDNMMMLREGLAMHRHAHHWC